MTPAFADPASHTRPLHVVSTDGLAEFLSRQSAQVQAWLTATGFAAGLGDLRLIPGAEGVSAAVIGHGNAKTRARQRFALAKAATGLPAGAWAIAGDLTLAERDEAALGWLLAQYAFNRYRPGKTELAPALLRLPEGCNAARLLAMAAGEYLTRDLINTPAADMGPEELQEAFLALASQFGAVTKVVTGDDLLAQNFPMIHAVGRASPRAPRLLEMTWGEAGPHLTLVGKGVCFDTGGLNIKTAGMALMKKDMGGAATVMGLAQMIMQLSLPVRLRVIVAAVENVISGNALKPKDILTSRKGLTVEVNDTDAEGRLILGDALALANETPTDAIISMATLTGAARTALGPDLAPYYTDDAVMAAALEAGGAQSFDPVWRMPFHTPYEHIIEPGIADLDNAPGWGFAGSVTAALFLRRFADHPRYMHFDIYGHSPADLPGRPKGAVGQGARAILAGLPAMLGL
jgi:leucyl aminopeptidase